MPFIHVKSLPFKPALKMDSVLEGFTKNFAKGTGMVVDAGEIVRW